MSSVENLEVSAGKLQLAAPRPRTFSTSDMVATRQCSNEHGVCPMHLDSLQ